MGEDKKDSVNADEVFKAQLKSLDTPPDAELPKIKYADAELNALAKIPILHVQDEFEVPEIGAVKVLLISLTEKNPVPQSRDIYSEYNNTGQIPPEKLPDCRITYKLPLGHREKTAQTFKVRFRQFLKFVGIKE